MKQNLKRGIRFKTSLFDSHPVEVPDWAEPDSGYYIEADILNDLDPMLKSKLTDTQIMALSYFPKHIDYDLFPYVRIYITDTDGNPFHGMSQLWEYVIQTKMFSTKFGTIYSDGTIKSIDGNNPNAHLVFEIGQSLLELYELWMLFPKETSFKTAIELRQAQIDLDTLNCEIDERKVEKSIDEIKENIEKLRSELAKTEKLLNDVYERGADAANLLEKHGYPVDIHKEKEV